MPNKQTEDHRMQPCEPEWRGRDVYEIQLKALELRDESARFELGDLLVMAESHLHDDAYEIAQRVTHWSRKHLIDIASTARRCPPTVRNPNLTYSHHRNLANGPYKDKSDDEKRELLAQALEEGWPANELLKSSYTPAVTEKTITVSLRVPLRVYETFDDLAAVNGNTIQQVMQEFGLLATLQKLTAWCDSADTQRMRSVLKSEKRAKEKAQRSKRGKRLVAAEIGIHSEAWKEKH